jgi:hypothetical protein
MRFLEHGIKNPHSYAATCHQIDCRGLARRINSEEFSSNHWQTLRSLVGPGEDGLRDIRRKFGKARRDF